MVKLYVIIITAVLLCQRGGQTANIRVDNDLNNEIDSPADQTLPEGALKKFIQVIERPAHKVVHAIGKTVNLTCVAMGSPAPTIRWLKNDQPVHDYNPETNQILDMPSESSIAKVHSSLLVSAPSKNLEDIYTCVITAGPIVEKAVTTVYTADSNTELSHRTHPSPMRPVIVYTYKAFMDIIGRNAVIPCRAKGHPRVNVYWRDNVGAIVTRSNRRMRVLKTGELIIRNIRWADMGDYICIARNPVGKVTSTTFVYPVKAG